MKHVANLFKVDKASLLKEYNSALKNEKFKNLIEKLKLPKEILMKYTSMLEESSIIYDTCKNCKGLVECTYDTVGYAYLPKVKNKELEFNLIPCKYRKKIDKDTKHYKNIYLFEIPKEIKEASMKNIFKKDESRFETIEWLDKFIENYPVCEKGLYLYGSFGSGKTYLIAAMFNELAKKGIKSAIIFYPEFLRSLKASFNTDFDIKYERIKKVPLLLIDDIGSESTTEWSRDEILCPILQYRMQEGLKTFFTSNLDLDALEKHLSLTKDKVSTVKAKRVIERIKQLTEPIEMISENLRK